MLKIQPIKALVDNYIWAIHDSRHTIIVDPGEAKPVLEYLQKNHLELDAILLTHHHWDHTNGIQELLQHFPSVPVYGSKTDGVPSVTQWVKEGDEIHFPNFPSSIRVMDIPGHTLGHLAFLYEEALFCGDTLFSCGCGRIFEGTASQMQHSLQKIAALPPKTNIYCGHEYTLANIAFAQMLDPSNMALENRRKQVEDLRSQGLPSLPVSLELELETNPFLRATRPEIIAAAHQNGFVGNQDPISIFAYLREWKNKF